MIHGKLSNQNFIARINARSEIKTNDTLPLAFSLAKAHFLISLPSKEYEIINECLKNPDRIVP